MRDNLMNHRLDNLAEQIKGFKQYYHEHKHLAGDIMDFEIHTGIKQHGCGFSKVADGHNAFIKNDLRSIAATYNMFAEGHNATSTPGSKILEIIKTEQGDVFKHNKPH